MHHLSAADRAPESDDALMVMIGAGSARALGELHDRYAVRAHRVAWAVCHDSGRAEDAVQEAFASIHTSHATYRSQQGTVGAWVMTIVHNRAIDAYRRHAKHTTRRASESALATIAAPGDVLDEIVARSDGLRVIAALAELPGAQREVICLGFYSQLSHREIAERLNLPIGTVKGRIRLGLEKLRLELDLDLCFDRD